VIDQRLETPVEAKRLGKRVYAEKPVRFAGLPVLWRHAFRLDTIAFGQRELRDELHVERRLSCSKHRRGGRKWLVKTFRCIGHNRVGSIQRIHRLA